MAEFECNVVRIDDVTKHPNADRLDLVTIGGYVCIANKNEDGTSRYKPGDLVVYIPENAMLPDWLLKEMGFWDENKNLGSLHGSRGNRVKPMKLRGIFSQGILYPVMTIGPNDGNNYYIKYLDDPVIDPLEMFLHVQEGENVAEELSITKYEPQVPATMAGQISGEYIQHTMKYDFESIQKNWNLFDDGEDVVVTEKIHGTLMQIGYIPELNDPKLFGSKGNIFVTSKGIGAKGFILKNLEANKDNLYVRILQELLNDGLEERLNWMYNQYEYKSIHIFAEIFGKGIQDLGYNQNKPTIGVFDVACNKQYLVYSSMIGTLFELNLKGIPTLYQGPFDRDKIMEFRDGKDTISGTHIREGIVIKTAEEKMHPRYGRKIAKWVSPSYLLRKNGTEWN